VSSTPAPEPVLAGASVERDAPSEMLAVEDLRRTFGGVHAVDGASFSVAQGTICGLIGPNGAGKSTTVGMIAGALRPSSGTVLFDGHDVTGLPSHRIARLGIVRTFQIAGVFEQLTVLENLLVGVPHLRGERLGEALMGKWFWRRAERDALTSARSLLARFKLMEKQDERAGTLSGGQRRLVEIMRALMARPRLMLLDEPTAGVAPSGVLELQDTLEELREEGITMLLVEHALGVVERLCDNVVVMAQGKTLATGTMQDLRRRKDVLDAYLIG
jgi:ABC-type branched-subunit amino acid transport system ATPase component